MRSLHWKREPAMIAVANHSRRYHKLGRCNPVRWICLAATMFTLVIGASLMVFLLAPFAMGARTQLVQTVVGKVLGSVQGTVTTASLFGAAAENIRVSVGSGILGVSKVSARQSVLDVFRAMGSRLTLDELSVEGITYTPVREKTPAPSNSTRDAGVTPFMPCLPQTISLHVSRLSITADFTGIARFAFHGSAATREGIFEAEGVIDVELITSGLLVTLFGTYSGTGCDHKIKFTVLNVRTGASPVDAVSGAALSCAVRGGKLPHGIRCKFVAPGNGSLTAELSAEAWRYDKPASVEGEIFVPFLGSVRLFSQTRNSTEVCMGWDDSEVAAMVRSIPDEHAWLGCKATMSNGLCTCASALPMRLQFEKTSNGVMRFGGTDGFNVLDGRLGTTGLFATLSRSQTLATLSVTSSLDAEFEATAPQNVHASITVANGAEKKLVARLDGEISRLIMSFPVGVDVNGGFVEASIVDGAIAAKAGARSLNASHSESWDSFLSAKRIAALFDGMFLRVDSDTLVVGEMGEIKRARLEAKIVGGDNLGCSGVTLSGGGEAKVMGTPRRMDLNWTICR